MNQFISACVFLFFICSCGSTTGPVSAKDTLTAMLGSWSFEGSDLTETWSKIDETHYRGTVNRSFNGVLEPVQHIDIRFHGDKVSYEGTRIGAHQSALPIKYFLEHAVEDQMKFAHAKGGFPQEILYEIIDRNSFSVTMSGTQDGRARSQRFNYSRIE